MKEIILLVLVILFIIVIKKYPSGSKFKKRYYIIVDTCFFISQNCKQLRSILNLEYVTIIIPRIVLLELDKLKETNKNTKLYNQIGNINKMIKQNYNNKFIIQKPDQRAKFDIEEQGYVNNMNRNYNDILVCNALEYFTKKLSSSTNIVFLVTEDTALYNYVKSKGMSVFDCKHVNEIINYI